MPISVSLISGGLISTKYDFAAVFSARLRMLTHSLQAGRLVVVAGLVQIASVVMAQSVSGTALVRHAPHISGRVEGSIQVMKAEDVTLNGDASVSGDLLIRGTPKVKLHGTPTYGGTLEGTGAVTPSHHKVSLQGRASLGHVVRRIDPRILPAITPPPKPAGTRSVVLNSHGAAVGNYSTLRNLTLNRHAGQRVIPPGTYGNFTAHSDSGFTLGVAGSLQPSVYNFQRLTLNRKSVFTLVGPVVITVRDGCSPDTTMGNPMHPEWLQLRIAKGGLILTGNKTVYGLVEAPAGECILKGGSRLIGGLTSDRLTVNGNALLRLLPPVPSNQPPRVTLISPQDGIHYPAPATISLRADASDDDGSIAKVEFFHAGIKLGEDPTFPYEYEAADLGAGSYLFAARATDNEGSFTDSPLTTITVTPSVAAVLPYLTGFEAAEGYALGAMHGQLGWDAAGSIFVTSEDHVTGSQSVLVPPQSPPAVLSRLFDPHPENPVVFADFYLLPRAGVDDSNSARVSLVNAADLVFVRAGEAGRILVRHGDGTGGGIWQASIGQLPLDPEGYSTDWVRLTLRLDYDEKEWDLSVNGTMAAASVGFSHTGQTGLGGFTLTGQAETATLLDDFLAVFENPLFADLDRDGMPDAWESTHGLDPSSNDRDEDKDADGLENLGEFLLGTKPDTKDTDGDSLSDGQERDLGTNPVSLDSDADGMPDGWEQHHGLNPLSADDALADLDHDGRTNFQEYIQGSDPSDYYNGLIPTITSLEDSDGRLSSDGAISVVVEDAAGRPLVGAPVIFTATAGGHLLAATAGGSGADSVEVRSNGQGLARAYIVSGP